MTTVLAYTSPAIGHLFPMLPLLLELRDRGFDVHVRTLEGGVEQVRGAGLKAEPIDERIERLEHLDWEAGSTRAALIASTAVFAERALLDAPDFRRALDEVGPDLLVVDINSWGAAAAAEASGLPWVSFSPYVLPLRSPGTPPFGPGFDRTTSPLGRLRDAVAGPLVFSAVEKAFMPGINLVRSTYGLAPLPDSGDFFTRADLVLNTTAEPFDYPQPTWPAKVRRIGHLAWEPETETPGWAAELADPLTLVTTSSEYQHDESLARVAIEALAECPGSVVVTMPAGVPRDLGPLPPRVRVERFVPHGRLLPRSSVVVTHGGMGATQKALAAGVPVCVVPFGRDQAETAARVVHAGAGTRLAKKRLTPDRLRDAVDRAERMRAGAQAVAAGYVAAGGAAAGAAAIEELLPRR